MDLYRISGLIPTFDESDFREDFVEYSGCAGRDMVDQYCLYTYP